MLKEEIILIQWNFVTFIILRNYMWANPEPTQICHLFQAFALVIDHCFTPSAVSIANPSLRDSHVAILTHLIRSEVLFALGLTLIELRFGQTLSELQTPEDVNSVEAFTNYRTATRLLDYVYNESGSRYEDVVRRCLQCSFDLRDASLDNEEFQQGCFQEHRDSIDSRHGRL